MNSTTIDIEQSLKTAVLKSLDQMKDIDWRMLAFGLLMCALAVILYEIICLILRKDSLPLFRRLLFGLALAWWVYVIADITILQRAEVGRSVNFTLFEQLRIAGVSGVTKTYLLYTGLNVLLFIPFGFLLGGIMPRGFIGAVLTIIGSIGASCYIEVAQYMLSRGVSDIEDVAVNVLGALIGYLLAWLFVLRRERDPER